VRNKKVQPGLAMDEFLTVGGSGEVTVASEERSVRRGREPIVPGGRANNG